MGHYQGCKYTSDIAHSEHEEEHMRDGEFDPTTDNAFWSEGFPECGELQQGQQVQPEVNVPNGADE